MTRPKNILNLLRLRREAEQNIDSLPDLITKSEKISYSIIHGLHAQKKSGTGEQFWQYRNYHQDIDTPQSIDWRQSAKSDTVFTKQKELQTTQKTYIWRASGSSMNYRSSPDIYTKQDCANIIGLSLALILRKSGEQIGLFGDKKTGRSERELQKITQILLDSSKKEEILPNGLEFTLPSNAHFIAIGDFLSPIEEIKSCFDNLNTKNAIIIQVLDPAEIDLNYKGRVKFYNNAGSEEIVDNVEEIHNDYKKRVTSHIDDIARLCHEQNWHYALHTTDNDITYTLQNIISEVGK